MAVMIQARHLFYGLSMLDKFKGLGWFYFFVTLLNQFYWVASATIGGIIGSLRSGFLYDSDNDTDCTSTDSTSKVAGTICYMLILYFL